MGLISRLFGKKLKVNSWSSKDNPPENLTSDQVGEIVDGLRGKYEERIKPYIVRGDFRRAHLEMDELVVYLEVRAREVGLNIHSGFGYINGAKLLRDALENATNVPQEQLEYFEAMQAQTRLPYRRGN